MMPLGFQLVTHAVPYNSVYCVYGDSVVLKADFRSLACVILAGGVGVVVAIFSRL